MKIKFLFASLLLIASAAFGQSQFSGGGGGTGGGSFPSGVGLAGAKISGTGVTSQAFIPTVDVRWFFTNPFPTYAQAESQDFGAVLNAALVAATANGACVDVGGLNILNYPNLAVFYATTNPYAGLTSNVYVPCIIGANFQVVIGATWATPGGALRIEGDAPGGIGGTGLVLQPCNTTGGCSGQGGLTVSQFPTSAGCASSGGTNCYATGLPSSGALSEYTTGTITFTTNSTTVTGSGVTWTTAMIGGTLLSGCPSNTCTIGATSSYTTNRIVNVSGSTITLASGWTGTLGSGSGGENYIIFLPNTSVAFCDGCLGANLQKSFTGHQITNLTIDLNGISGAGFYTKSSQEGSILTNYSCSLQGASPTGATAGGTCLAWDQSVREAANTNQTFLGHWSVYGGRIGVGNNSGGASAFGIVVEGFSVMDGTVALSQANGASVFEPQAVIGGSGSARFQDAVYIDGISGMFIAGTHLESTLNDDWNIGAVNPTYNININGITSSGTLGNCVIEFHSSTSGNQIHGVSRPSGGCLAEDDNLGTPTIATSTAGTPSTWTMTEYLQPGSGSVALALGGALTLNGGSHGISIPSGTQYSGASGSVVYGADSGSSGYAEVNENNGGYSRVCTAANGVCWGTTSKCAAAGSAANPSVASCSAAAAGAFSCATNASTGTCQVNTSAVTANSTILVQPDASLGSLLSVTCNTTADTGLTAPRVASRSAGSSFTINLGTFSTNPLCFGYTIIN